MAFGKRVVSKPVEAGVDADGAPIAAPARLSLSSDSSSGPSTGMFIAIALGVVAIAGGGAFVLSGKMASASTREVIRPIEELAAQLDHDQLKTALITQAFPDSAGKSFMTSLARFPTDRDALLGRLADKAKAGGGRNELFWELNAWSIDFANANYQAIGRTGAMGYDRSMQIASATLDLMTRNKDCTIASLRELINDPSGGIADDDYGTPGYRLAMQSNQAVIDLTVAGEKMPFIDPVMRVSDGKAVVSALSSFSKDPQAMAIIGGAMNAAGGEVADKRSGNRKKKKKVDPTEKLAPDDVDTCALGKTILGKMQGLPAETKDRVWAIGVSRQAMDAIVAKR